MYLKNVTKMFVALKRFTLVEYVTITSLYTSIGLILVLYRSLMKNGCLEKCLFVNNAFFFIVKAIVEQAIIIFKDRFVLNQVLNVINVIDFY